MALIKIEARTPQQMVLQVAEAYGYYEPKNPPMWWDTFWAWYLSYVVLVREGRLIGAMLHTTPHQAIRWFMARALMENDYNEDGAQTDMSDTKWYDEAVAEFAAQEYNNPLPGDDVSPNVVIIVERDDAETNPWKRLMLQDSTAAVTDTATPPEFRENVPQQGDGAIDFKDEMARMAKDEVPEKDIKFPHTGVLHNDPKMTPEHRAALAMPGDKVDMHEPMPAKCLMGAPGSQLDDDKLYHKDAWCAARGPNTPPEGDAPKAESDQFGAIKPINGIAPDARGNISTPTKQFGATPEPARPAQHQCIAVPDDDRPVDERLAEAQPGDRVSIVEPVPDKCLFGAKSALPDDDVVHADEAFCGDTSMESAEDDGDYDEDDDESYDEDDGPWDDDDVNAPESSVESDLEPEDNGPSDDEIEDQMVEQAIEAQEEARLEQAIEDQQIDDAIEAQEEARIESVIPTGTPDAGGDVIMPGAVVIPEQQPEISVEHVNQREAEFAERITPPEVVDDSVELDRAVPSVPVTHEDTNIDTSKDIVDELVENVKADVAIDESEETKHDGDGWPVDYDEGDEQPQ